MMNTWELVPFLPIEQAGQSGTHSLLDVFHK